LVISAELADLQIAEASSVHQVQVIGNRVPKRAKAILGSISFKVGLDPCCRHLGVECRKDEPATRNQAVSDLLEEQREVREVLAHERTQDGIERVPSYGELVVQVRLGERNRREFARVTFNMPRDKSTPTGELPQRIMRLR
jgi:hypothetical protein